MQPFRLILQGLSREYFTGKAKSRDKKRSRYTFSKARFATHLLEKDTDIKVYKSILGHFDIKTTERHLHVIKKELVNIITPLDDLWQKGKIDW